MTRTLVAIALIGTLTACNSSQDLTNLPVRNGPQTISPYDTSATNPTKLQGGIIN